MRRRLRLSFSIVSAEHLLSSRSASSVTKTKAPACALWLPKIPTAWGRRPAPCRSHLPRLRTLLCRPRRVLSSPEIFRGLPHLLHPFPTSHLLRHPLRLASSEERRQWTVFETTAYQFARVST